MDVTGKSTLKEESCVYHGLERRYDSMALIKCPECGKMVSDVPKLNHFSRKGETEALATVHDVNAWRRILSNIKAIEGVVLFASIAMGVLQLIALDGRSCRSAKKIRYLRTISRKCPSEATVMYYVRKNIYSLLLQHPDSFITRFIRKRQVENSGSSRKRAA